MTLPINFGKTSAKGSFNLFWGIVISNVILAVYAIVVARLLDSASYGLYTLSSIPATLFGLFVGFGVRQATVKKSAQFNYRDETEKIKKIAISGLLFVAISGFTLAILSFLLSGWIANLFARPYAKSLIEICSLTVLTDALIVASQSIFIGLEKMHYYSILLILQAILRCSISLILIVIGLGTLGAVAGYTLASLGTCVLGLIAVYFAVIKGLKFPFAELEILKNLKQLISYGIPLYLRKLMESGFRVQILNFLMVTYTSNILIGNYKVALNFQVLVGFFVIPIETILFPAFSKLEFKHYRNDLRTIFSSSIKYTSLIIIPATVAIIVLSENMVSTLYGKAYTLAPTFLSLGALIFLYAAFGQYSISALLNSQGETKKSMVLGLANVTLALPLALILIPHFQIVGLIISLFFSGLPSIVLGHLWVKKLYNFSINWNQTGRILACSSISGALTFAIVEYFSLSKMFGLLVGLAVFSLSFITIAPLIGAINLDDISSLRIVFSGMEKLSRLSEPLLRSLAKFCKFVNQSKKDK